MAENAAYQTAAFPTRLVTIVALATLVLLAWLSWTVYRDYRIYAEDGQRLLQLSSARGSIIHLDEVLTMSATMAAVTGETSWIDRYQAFEPQLTKAITTAITMARSPNVEAALQTTDAANARLIEMETKAFELVRAGQGDGARTLLFGDEYRVQKDVYAKGMAALERALDNELTSIVSDRQATARNGVIAVVGVSLMILATWLVLFQRVRNWRAAVTANYDARVAAEATVRRINEGLEATVADRTRALTRELAARELAEKKLLEVQRMRAAGQLTGGVAHEFNNLLAVIRSNAEDLFEELKSSPLQPQADLIVRAADRGAGFVRQLLVFSQKREMEPKLVDVNAFLDSALGLIRSTLEANIAIEVSKAAGLPLINVDPGQLESALTNIIVNSRDAMPKGGTITIETAAVNLDAQYVNGVPEVLAGAYVLIAVTDTGSGMTKDVLESAFVPFFTTKEVGEGTGLGLSTVHGFVTQSAGEVRLYSEPGFGTSVKLYFPVAVGVAAAEDAGTGNADGDSKPVAARILIAEDDALMRQSVERKLRAFGCTVFAVGSVDEAIAHLEEDANVDLVFSDVIMPGARTGGDLAWEVQRRWPQIRLLLTSGYTETATLGKVKIPPGIHVLSKPYSNADLANALREALGPTAAVIAFPAAAASR